MNKPIKLTDSKLTEMVKKMIKEQSDYSTDIDRPTSDRERGVKKMFGDKYGSYIPNDVLRYIRKNPTQFFKKVYEVYGDKAYDFLDKAKSNFK